MVIQEGFEPPTHGLEGLTSIALKSLISWGLRDLKTLLGATLGPTRSECVCLADDIRNAFVIIRYGVAVKVERVADFAVSQALGNFGDGYTVSKQLRGHSVAQNVEVLVFNAC